MTVAPNRPQDGTHQPLTGGSDVEPKDRTRLASVPPTLFKLPNLGVKASQSPMPIGGGSVDQAGDVPGLSFELERNNFGPAEISSLDLARDAASAVGGDATTGFGEAPSQLASPKPGSIPSVALHVGSPGGVPIADVTTQEALASSRRIESDSPVIDTSQLQTLPQAANGLSASTPGDFDTESADQSSAPTPSASTASRRSIPQDVPAGRSWMETLGSHGVVIVLLLFVVAAALLTGGDEDDMDGTSLTRQSELLNFDELNADLPLPMHEESSVDLADSIGVPVVDSHPRSASDLVVNMTERAAVPAVSPQSDESSSRSVASLEPPLTAQSPEPSAGLIEEGTGEFVFNGVTMNEFVSPSAGVEASPAGNRTKTGTTESSLPSLEELAGIQEQAGAASQSSSTDTARASTKTPAGIPDWSKYLPPLNSAPLNSAVEPEAAISSSPYQVLQP